MADTLLPPPPSGHDTVPNPKSLLGEEYTSDSRTTSAPLPNPEFSFPMVPLDQATKDLEELLPSPPAAGGRHRPANISVDPVSTPWGLLPPPSPIKFASDSPQSSPKRGGHRRGGSEFIGGDGSTKGPGLMSTSPTKGETALSSIPASGRRRGHAHRRSGAISHHDLSAILKPATHEPLPTRPGSLPSSPTVQNAPPLDRSSSQPALFQASSDVTPPATPSQEKPRPNFTSPPTTRPRVGFSDTVEFIPRPLSTISSDTSSSLSTIRASHSVTGSITSIISNGTPSPSSARKSQYTADILERYHQDTVDAHATGSPSPNPRTRRGSPPPAQPPQPALESPSNDEFPLQRKGSAPNLQEPHSPSTSEYSESQQSIEMDNPLPTPPSSAGATLKEFSRTSMPLTLERPHSSPETSKAVKKQRKVKSWAGSLLSRRAKGKMPENLDSTTSSTVSRENFASFDDFSLDDVNLDEDNTCVINSPEYAPLAMAYSPSADPMSAPRLSESDDTGVLDLDATWVELDENEKASGFHAAKKRMHSSGATGAFTGPGMHYHRRADSAPALTPVSSNSRLHRLGSNSQMADVFEEEEEHEEPTSPLPAGSVSAPSEGEAPGLVVDQASIKSEGTELADSASVNPNDPLPTIVADNLDVASQLSEVQTPRDAIPDELVEIVDSVDEPRFSVLTKSSDESTITPTMHTPNPLGSDRGQTPPLNTKRSMGTPSASSTDVSHVVFEAPTLKTAASSITDRSMRGSSKNGVGAMSYSTEDVPSLTSSASTTFSGYHAQGSSFAPSLPAEERSYSFSGTSHRRPISAAKRASMASLTRLMNSAQSNRSKLSLEVFSQADTDPDASEKKKRNRISRLVKFWKPKDKPAA